MPTQTLTQEPEQLERRYWQLIKEGDLEGALDLTDDPCIVVGASGPASIDHATFANIMKGADYRIHDADISDVISRQLTPDVVLLAYKVTERLTVDGEPVTLEAADSSVWVRRDDHWVSAMHTESVLGDAYGRDRIPADKASGADKG